MSMVADLHIHTRDSDGQDDMDTMCRAAVTAGLHEIAFTDHLDLDPQDRFFNVPDAASQALTIARLRREYGDWLTIRHGVEVSYQPDLEADIRSALSSFSYDLVIGAVHRVDGRDFSYGDDVTELASRLDLVTACRPYFEYVTLACASGLFDIIAHFDLPKRFGGVVWGEWDPRPLKAEIGRALVEVVRGDLALEFNSSGYDQQPGEPFPSLFLFAQYFDLGGRLVSFGSDAHRASHVGRYRDRAAALGKELGLSFVRYEARRRL